MKRPQARSLQSTRRSKASNSRLGESTAGREKEIETAFVADEDKTDISAWLYNRTPEQPRDLGYWVGYRIVKSYYQHATDKRRALHEILQVNDPNRSWRERLVPRNVDRLGGQAKTILIGHLQETGRFNVLERENMEEIAQEARLSGRQQTLKGADFAITGDVVEFGRKETGDSQLYGILGSGKRQVAYSKVTLNVVNVLTSQVVYSASGAGEYALSNREVIGFGGTASYDSTLNGKVLDLAIREAVDRLVEGLESGSWSSASASR